MLRKNSLTTSKVRLTPVSISLPHPFIHLHMTHPNHSIHPLFLPIAAALSLTTLFRSSKSASKRAYNAGYSAACHDLLNMIQQGVSTDADPSREVTIGRIMDYIEARLEAIRAREEEEDEEEEKERAARGGPPSTAGPSAVAKPAAKASSPTLPPAPARRDQVRSYHPMLVVCARRQQSSCLDHSPSHLRRRTPHLTWKPVAPMRHPPSPRPPLLSSRSALSPHNRPCSPSPAYP